jgi:hypothetical protein
MEVTRKMLNKPAHNGVGKDWYFITIREGFAASEFEQKIKDVFLKFFTTSGTKEGMGVFIRHDILKQTATFYFTPTAAAIAKIFRAFSCERPQKLGITLFVGPDTCWKLFSDLD